MFPAERLYNVQTFFFDLHVTTGVLPRNRIRSTLLMRVYSFSVFVFPRKRTLVCNAFDYYYYRIK